MMAGTTQDNCFVVIHYVAEYMVNFCNYDESDWHAEFVHDNDYQYYSLNDGKDDDVTLDSLVHYY